MGFNLVYLGGHLLWTWKILGQQKSNAVHSRVLLEHVLLSPRFMAWPSCLLSLYNQWLCVNKRAAFDFHALHHRSLYPASSHFSFVVRTLSRNWLYLNCCYSHAGGRHFFSFYVLSSIYSLLNVCILLIWMVLIILTIAKTALLKVCACSCPMNSNYPDSVMKYSLGELIKLSSKNVTLNI